MKDSLAKLTQRKRGELARIVSIIRSSARKHEYNWPAFMLHQAAECYYSTVLLVHTNYKPNTHDLDTLRRLAANQDPALFKVFPLRTSHEKRCFDLLRQAYVGARYHDDYKITPRELKYLARCVELLREQTEKSCETKMNSFCL